MQCTYCPGNQASCHLTKIVNGQTVEVHVCEKCIPQVADPDLIEVDLWESVAKLAKSKGQVDPAKKIEPQPSEISAKTILFGSSANPVQQCSHCGFTHEDVRKTGRLGCPQCYDVFTEMLHDVLNDCQKGMQHTGKIPASMRGLQRLRLEKELGQAVMDERFEDAAMLRDQIAQLGSGRS